MAQVSLDWVQGQVASIVDLDPVTTNISSANYALRLNYINRALEEWSETTDWAVLYREYNALVSTSTGNASIALPTNFRKLASFPLINQSSSTDKYPEVDPPSDGQFGDSDKRCWILGGPSQYTLRIFGTTLASGASVKVPYYASAQSLVSPANIIDIPNPQYLVQKCIGYVFEGVEDPRFLGAKAEAETILGNMLERENTPNRASWWDSVRTVDQTRGDYRWGRD